MMCREGKVVSSFDDLLPATSPPENDADNRLLYDCGVCGWKRFVAVDRERWDVRYEHGVYGMVTLLEGAWRDVEGHRCVGL